ncbi:DUF6452 family protein [Zhouia sp. PK063]|uniref:DUF6452 family protein n=1 Tax=Zhouia sp. PK063 TaxID=3373602 RepID=UPI0037AA23CD
MKKLLSFVIIILIISCAFVSCEKDDICTDITTPRVVIGFYDNTNHSTSKTVTNLKVVGVGKDTSYVYRETTDSIALPLKQSENVTKYVFYTNSGDDADGNEVGNADTITINYTKHQEFVSKACGYSTFFTLSGKPALTADDNNWILNTETVIPNVDNESQIHIKIYH